MPLYDKEWRLERISMRPLYYQHDIVLIIHTQQQDVVEEHRIPYNTSWGRPET